MKKSVLLIFLVLFVDQLVKIWIKTNMWLGEEKHLVGDWFIIHFTENEGMAFGWTLGGENGKLFLSIFRLIACAGIGWYLWTIIKAKMHTGLIVSISLVFAGAFGNILDSTFYGVLFSESTSWDPAVFMPAEGGYAGFLHGKVVDMLYFPIIEGYFPSWFPLWGGEDFVFFRPVFNISDASITVGVSMLILFQKKYWPKNIEVSA